jgi:hypothetical protein
MPFDTTIDTTEGAPRSNRGQPPAKKTAYLSQFCNVRQHSETDVSGLWLRRSRVRAPSVTLSFARKTQASTAPTQGGGSSRAAVKRSSGTFAVMMGTSSSRTLLFALCSET